MAEPEILFDVDASKILAKLHLGALEAVKQWLSEGFFVNTGIKNDNPSAKPDNPGKVEFDLTNGEYEIGYVTSIDFEAHDKLNQLIDKISPIIAKIKTNQKIGEAEESSNNKNVDEENKPLLSKDKNQKKHDERKERDSNINGEIKKAFDLINAEIKKFEKDLVEIGIDPNKQLEDIKKTNDFANLLKKANEEEKKKNPNYEDLTVDKITSYDNILFYPELFKKTMEQLVSNIMEAVKKKGSSTSLDNISDKDFKNAFSGLQAYMNVFVGDKANALKEDNVIKQFAPSEAKDSNDKKLVANYEIVPADDKEVELQQKNNEANKDKATMRVCFKIGYSVQIDK